MLLTDLTVLIVDDDAECSDVLGAHLFREGAKASGVRSGAAALEFVTQARPDVVICELVLPDFDGRSLLSALRSTKSCGTTPALALTAEPALVGYARALGAGFEKYLIKPARLSDVTDALCCIASERQTPISGVAPSLGEISESLGLHDYRTLLRTLNATTTHRHTSLFRFDGIELTSVWTFDRERPSVDPFPLRLKTAETPCALLRASRLPIALDDTNRDERTSVRHRAHGMRALCGVPLVDATGATYGALCHFDPEPRPAHGPALDLLERVARMFQFLGARGERARPPA